MIVPAKDFDVEPYDIVMISGPESMSKGFLIHPFTYVLSSIVNKKASVLVGDCPAFDSVVQHYFQVHSSEVLVYYMSSTNKKLDEPRFMHPSLEMTQPVVYSDQHTSVPYYEHKDMVMVDECTMGLFVWDGVCKRTFRNIHRVRGQDKMAWVWYPHLNELHKYE